MASQQERPRENGPTEPLLHANARTGPAGIAICLEQPNRRIRDPYVRVVWAFYYPQVRHPQPSASCLEDGDVRVDDLRNQSAQPRVVGDLALHLHQSGSRDVNDVCLLSGVFVGQPEHLGRGGFRADAARTVRTCAQTLVIDPFTKLPPATSRFSNAPRRFIRFGMEVLLYSC